MIRKLLLAFVFTLSMAVLAQGHVVLSPELSVTGGAFTSTATELNYLDIAVLGTGAANKAVVLDAGDDYTWPASGILTYGVLKDPAATTITSTGAEMNYLDLASLGTGAASKALVLDAGEDYIWPATGILTYGVLKDPAGTTLGATAAEINQHADVSAMSELVTDDELVASTDCGKTYFIATDAKVFTLPPTIAGCELNFVNVGAATNNNVRVDPDDNDYIAGTFTLAASVVVKDTTDGSYIDNTKGTSNPGNSVTLIGDGVGGWFITASTGIWASE